MTGFCLKCRQPKEIKDAENIIMKNGLKAIKGKCPDCGTKIFRILGKEKDDKSQLEGSTGVGKETDGDI